MVTGAEQLGDWMARRGFNKTETAEFLGFDITFFSKLINGHRNPGLTNAVHIERLTGIPVEAWMASEHDEAVSVGSKPTAKRK